MHHAVSAVEAIHGRIEGHDEDPATTCITRVVNELGENETRVVLRRHHCEDDGPRDPTRDRPEGAE